MSDQTPPAQPTQPPPSVGSPPPPFEPHADGAAGAPAGVLGGDRPEVEVGAAFAGGALFALILRRLAS